MGYRARPDISVELRQGVISAIDLALRLAADDSAVSRIRAAFDQIGTEAERMTWPWPPRRPYDRDR